VRELAWSLLLLAACSPARRRVDGTVVRHVGFEGNGGWFSGHDDYTLAEQMEQGESTWGLLTWPFTYSTRPILLDHHLLERDAFRLEVWYAHHGWFDARVDGWQLRELRRPRDRRAAVVDVWGLIEPGPRSMVRALDLVGLPDAPPGGWLPDRLLRSGDFFDLGLVESTRATLLEELVSNGYPYASVTVRSQADPHAQAVDVTFQAEPGIEGRLGAITVEGAERVRERFIRGALDLHEGDPYALDELQAAQRRLFQLGTFSIATVEPDLRDPTDPSVPVNVRVAESRSRTLRLGGGFIYDGFVPIVRAQARIRHVNLLGELIRADLGARAGLAYDLTRGFVLDSRLPTWGVDLRLEYPRILNQRGSLELNGTVEQDIYTGLWEYRRPALDLSLIYRFSDVVQGRIGPHFEDYLFIGGLGEDLSVSQQRLFGISGDALRYQLTALDQFFTLDWRDDPIRATRGGYLQLAAREAVALSDAGFNFVRVTADARRYFPLGGRESSIPLTLAGRVGGTYITPFGDTTKIPLPERAFLGGATGLRGFRPKQVGPYTTLCTYPSATEDDPGAVVRYDIPEGGNVAAQVGAEARYDATSGVTLAGFVELGALGGDLSELAANGPRASIGGGVRYDTSVGPIRFDLSFRPLYPEDSGPISYSKDCLVTDQDPRVFDFFSLFPGLRESRHPPFAMVFYLTFGEAL
jgi:outer membrane protein assembly factor BamA